MRSFIILIAIASRMIQPSISVGYMTTISAMWVSTTPGDGDYAVCGLQSPKLTASCSGKDDFANYTVPPGKVSFQALSGGGYFTCGLEYDTRFPRCWGQEPGSKVPEEHQQVSFSDLNSGGWHVCAVRSGSDQVHCWGDNTYGQTTPPSRQDFFKVTAGDTFTCGLSRSSSLATCWGQITGGNVTVAADPRVKFKAIYAGRIHVCGIIKDTGRTVCWGDNARKQCEAPADVKFLVLAGGLFHSCGLREDTHEAVCWGDNSQSQLRSVPKGVAFSSIAAGDWYSCGVRMIDRKIQCWGSLSATLQLETTRGVCSSAACNGEQYVDSSSGDQCASSEDKVCLDCSRGSCGNGEVVVSPCNGTSDRVCGSVDLQPPLSSLQPPLSSPPSPPRPGSSTFPTAAVVGGALGGFGFFGVAAAAGWFYRKKIGRKIRRDDAYDDQEGTWDEITRRVISFSSEQLQEATGGFDERMVIGKGSFGVVYKGVLRPTGQEIAIKKATSPGKSLSFDKELELLSRLHHANLVNLVGYCKADRLLVFEFMANGSVYDRLFNKQQQQQPQGGHLGLATRVKIALEAARGIEYLHHYATPKIIHRDIKTSNILLDGEWNAHVSDFGLSLFGPASDETHVSNMSVAGTPGYLDPEYFQTLQLTSKSDVYSFGVVLLELVTGHKAVNRNQQPEGSVQGIVPWVYETMKLRGRSAAEILVDKSLLIASDDLQAWSVVDHILHLASQCTDLRGKERPSMSFVVTTLAESLEVLKSDPSSYGTSSGFMIRRQGA